MPTNDPPRAELTPELLALVRDRYGCAVRRPPRDLGGSFNLNVLVDERWVVRVYRPWVTSERIEEVQRVRDVCRAGGVPVPEIHETRDGARWCWFGDRVVELEGFVPGERMTTREHMAVGMRLLGESHSHLEGVIGHVPAPVANHLSDATALESTLLALEVVEGWDLTPMERRYARAAETLARLVPVCGLDEQLVHGDFKDTNVLLRDTQVVGVLDFDFTGVRPRIDDLALAVHYELERGGASLDDARSWVDAYDSGLGRPLSAIERAAFPYAMARMPLAYVVQLPALGTAARRDFNERRGPACVWWLEQMRDVERWRRAFA